MASQQKSPFTLEVDATVAIFRLLKLSSGLGVHNTATSTDVPVGVGQEAGVDGDSIAVKDVKEGGTHKVTAAGAITKGADIYAAAAGKVQALPGEAATYRKVGIALEAAGADNVVFEAWLDPAGDTTTVAGS